MNVSLRPQEVEEESQVLLSRSGLSVVGDLKQQQSAALKTLLVRKGFNEH